MIQIQITEKQIKAEGHASTLICNSISVLMWSLATSLAYAQAKDLEEEEADGYQRVRYTPSRKTKPIFDGYAKSFELMAEQYPNSIQIVT